MKREEIEQRLRELPKELRAKVEKDPFPSAIIAFFAGIFVAGFPKLILSILVLVAAAMAAFWLLGDSDCCGGGCNKE